MCTPSGEHLQVTIEVPRYTLFSDLNKVMITKLNVTLDPKLINILLLKQHGTNS